ncbi:MAG: tRNA (adenosine(37)-N6)-dimethylallyltransferase MiaA [Anaerolineae bacterium]|nr:tRNA (adenosine(37)-N6)-dimethylallyltransferase MiaA [Phycisphaerae bacterium]
MAVADSSPQILVIIGPTASGKSALAIELARSMPGAEILSVDSMQVYRGMNIGTAKPSNAERARVPHHLIDMIDPNETFTVATFVELAEAVIRDAQARQIPLIVTGGTPLYFKSLFEGIFEGPGADEAIRARLSTEETAELLARLQSVDPAAAERIHLNDRRRLIRALEVFELTGQPISSFQTHWKSQQPKFDARWIGLTWERDALNRRINARVKQMIAAGWVDETRGLVAKYGTLSKTASEATGYAELLDHLAARISLDDAIEQIKIATRQLARRQMKWFRRFPNVTWMDGATDVNALRDAVLAT